MTEETSSQDGMSMEQATSKISAFFAAEEAPERKETAGEQPADQNSPTGDAAPQEPAPSGDERKAEPAEVPPIEPPASWDADAKTRFSKLPREDQEYLVRRESERDRELRRLQNETAERTKAFEAERAKLSQQLPPIQQQLNQLATALNNQMMSEFADITGPDVLARLAETDPQRYLRFDAHVKQLQHVGALQAQLKAQRDEETKREREAIIEQESKVLAKEIPELMDEKTGKDMRRALADHLIENGYSPQEVESIIHAKHIRTAWKAMKWDQAQKAAAAAKVVNLPRSIKPGTGSGPRDSDDERTAALMQHARKTGSVKDAAAAIARIL